MNICLVVFKGGWHIRVQSKSRSKARTYFPHVTEVTLTLANPQNRKRKNSSAGKPKNSVNISKIVVVFRFVLDSAQLGAFFFCRNDFTITGLGIFSVNYLNIQSVNYLHCKSKDAKTKSYCCICC